MITNSLTPEQNETFTNFLNLLNAVKAVLFKKRELPPGDVKYLLDIAADFCSASNYTFNLEDSWFHSKTTPLSFIQGLFSIPSLKIAKIGLFNGYYLYQLGQRFSKITSFTPDNLIRPLVEAGFALDDLETIYRDGILDDVLQLLERAFNLLDNNSNAVSFLSMQPVLYYILIFINLNQNSIRKIIKSDFILNDFLFMEDVTEADLVNGSRKIPQEALEKLNSLLQHPLTRIVVQVILHFFAYIIIKLKIEAMIYFDLEQAILRKPDPEHLDHYLKDYKSQIPGKISALYQQLGAFSYIKVIPTLELLKGIDHIIPMNILNEVIIVGADDEELIFDDLMRLYQNNITSENLSAYTVYILSETCVSSETTNLKIIPIDELFIDEITRLFKDIKLQTFVSGALENTSTEQSFEQELEAFTKFNRTYQKDFKRMLECALIFNINAEEMQQSLNKKIVAVFENKFKTFVEKNLQKPCEQATSKQQRQYIYYEFIMHLKTRTEQIAQLAALFGIEENQLTSLRTKAINNSVSELLSKFFIAELIAPKDFIELSFEKQSQIRAEINRKIIEKSAELSGVGQLVSMSQYDIELCFRNYPYLQKLLNTTVETPLVNLRNSPKLGIQAENTLNSASQTVDQRSIVFKKQ